MGVALGLAGALAARAAPCASLLYGVGATDPVTYAAVIALLVAVTIAACLLPAWRAARVNPLVALRGTEPQASPGRLVRADAGHGYFAVST